MDWRTHIARYGRQWFPGEPWVRATFILLFALAAILRFWNLPNLPYTHDELSALVRIYPTLGETIHRGVIELDTHPPGVQVLEWFWTKAFGMGEGVVKLPFVLLALVALFLLYRFALAWTSAPTALFTTTLLATLQYTVLYAQIARPYAIGFFTTALLADQLTRYLAFGTRRSLIGTGIAIILCAYTHHFALLLAGIMVLTGLGLVQRVQRKAYLLMCGVAALLYLPNLPIFLKQLALGGLDGWLQSPGPTWIPGYIHWILHFSPLLIGSFALSLLVALVLRSWKGGARSPAQWMLPLWGLAPLAVGYAYSVWHSPVLQYSLLLFSFPFVLMALFVGLRHLDRTWTLVLCSLITVTSSYSLISTRHHFEVFQGSRYEAMVLTAQRTISTYGPESTVVLFDAPEPQVQFYMKKHGLTRSDIPYIQLREGLTAAALDSLIANPKALLVVLGLSNGAAPEDAPRVQIRSPYVQERTDYLEGQVYVFAKQNGPTTIEDRTLLAQATPLDQMDAEFDIHQDLPTYSDTVAGKHGWLFADREFGVALRLPLTSNEVSRLDGYEVEMVIDSVSLNSELAVVLEFRTVDSTLLYRSSNVLHWSGAQRSAPMTLVTAASPSWIHAAAPELFLGAYAYDPAKGVSKIERIRVFRRKHNPIQNALLEPVE